MDIDAYAHGKDRQRNRSKTFPGIAKAMATQWGGYLLNNESNYQQTLFG